MKYKRSLFLYSLPSIPLTSAQIVVYIIIPSIYSVMPSVGITVTGFAIMFSRFTDMVTDPILGTYLDRLVPKIGWKVWLILGFPLISFGIYVLLNPIQEFEIVTLFIGLIAVTLGWTLYSIPWWGIGIAISTNSIKRFQIISAREILAIPGIIFGLIIAYLSEISGEMFLILSLLFISPLLIKKIPTPEKENKYSGGYFYNINVLLKTNHNFKRLCTAYFFIGLSNGLTSVLFILFVNFIIGGSPYFYLLTYFMSAFIGLPVIYLLVSKINKNKVWALFMLLACISFMPVSLLNHGDTNLFLLICIISGFCLGADLTIPAAIQAEIIYQAEKDENKILVGKIYSVWSLIQKLSLAISAGISLPLLGYFGFNPSEIEPFIYPLSIAYGVFPIILRLPAIFASIYINVD